MVRMNSHPYHLEILETYGCTPEKLTVFGRAHYSYINQIFGDEGVRNLIQDIYKKRYPGKLVTEPGVGAFSRTHHHVYKPDGRKKEVVCSAVGGYQNIYVDKNDTLCQSYSLLNYLKRPFDKTPADTATVEQKYNRQIAMIRMYQSLLDDPKFIERFIAEFIHKEYVRKGPNAWIDYVNHSKSKQFNIIAQYLSTPLAIIENIRRVLRIWEAYGWMYFVGNGVCLSFPNANANVIVIE